MTAMELRAIKFLPSGKNDTYVGYYDDPAIFEAHARRLNNDGYNIYSPINPIKSEVATELNQPPSRRRALRKEGVARRLVLPYDVDVDRPKGQAASDAELRPAREITKKIVDFWRERGASPRVKHSGNGFQIEVPIDLPNDAASEELVKKVQETHKAAYDIPGAHIDCWKDANRIFRVPGYKNLKGENSTERPQRVVKCVNEASGLATREMLEEVAKGWTKRSSSPSSGAARGTGAPDQDALTVLKDAYLRSGRVWSALKAARKQNLKLNGDHSTITAFANYLNNSWEEDRENCDGIVRVLETIWDECGTSSDGGRTENEVEDIVNHAFAKGRKPWVVCSSDGPLDPPYVPPAFVWSSQKNIPPPDQQYSDDPKWKQEGPLWTFTKEADFALFKHRVEQTPAWANAAEWKDPEGWPELPTDYEAWKASQPPTENGFKFPKVPGQVRDYTLLPLHSKFDGWFGRGRVHIVGGSSGAGKTSLMCDLLHRQWLRSSVLGHDGAGLRPLIIFADRGELSNAETLDRLGLTNAELPMAHLPVCWDEAASQGILKLVEERIPLPEIVFVEGADTLVNDANKTQAAAPFLSALQKIAKYYHIAFVLSLGAPKSRPREQHTLKRDRIFGSQIWPRMADTIATLEAVGDGTGKRRDLAVQHRNAASETFELEFQNGRLVQYIAPAECDALDVWISERDPKVWFTRDQAVEAMANGETGMGKSTVYKRLKDMLDAGTLEKQWSTEKKKEELRIKRLSQSDTPEARQLKKVEASDEESGVDESNSNRTSAELALREIWKDLDPEKLETMIQGAIGTETRA